MDFPEGIIYVSCSNTDRFPSGTIVFVKSFYTDMDCVLVEKAIDSSSEYIDCSTFISCFKPIDSNDMFKKGNSCNCESWSLFHFGCKCGGK